MPDTQENTPVLHSRCDFCVFLTWLLIVGQLNCGSTSSAWSCDLDLGNFVKPLVRLLLMLASSACTCLLMVAHRCATSCLFRDLNFDLGAVTLTLEILSDSLVRLLLMLASSTCTCLLVVAHRCAMSGLFMDLTFDLGAVT